MSQYLRPDSNISATNITGSYADLDEVTANDSDYITASATADGEAVYGLTDVTDPVSSSGHTIRFRARKAYDGGYARNVECHLYQVWDYIADFAANDISDTFTDYSYTLSAAEADSISDYTGLRLIFVTTGSYGAPKSNERAVYISWAEMEVPDVGGATVKTVTDTGAGTEVTPTLAAAFGLSDTGAGSEGPGNLAAWLTAADLGSGVETPNLTITLTVADSGNGLDRTALPQILAAILETGRGLEVIGAIRVAVTQADSGGGTEALTAAVSLVVNDAAQGLESLLNILQQIMVQVADTGMGTAAVSNVSVSLITSETGGGTDTPTVNIRLTIAEVGSGAELFQMAVSLAVSDGGHGLEALHILQAILARVADTGSGTEALTNLTVSLTAADSGNGVDSPAILVQVAISDAGAADEVLDLLTQTLVQILEVGTGSDGATVTAIQARVIDSGTGSATPALAVNLAITDHGGGIEAITRLLTGLLVAVADAGQGVDFTGPVTVNVNVADSGLATDQLATLLVNLALIEAGSGVETVVTFEASTRLVSLTFTFLRRTMTFSLARRTMSFTFSQRAIEFSLN